MRLLTLVTSFLAALSVLGMNDGARAQSTEKRLGLVIGNGSYAGAPLPTAANDAGLIAQTLQAAGFDVMGARDLDGDALRHTFRDFVDKVSASGPGSVAFIYLSGYGLQYEGDNYFVPVDAKIDRDLDVPLQALRLSDYLRPLAALKAKAVVTVLDAARAAPFAKAGQPLAGGLALIDAPQGMLYAFNAAPGTIGPEEQPPYGSYAQSLAEMIREGGLPLNAVFDRVRLRVNDLSRGAMVPWHSSQVQASFVFFDRGPDAPPVQATFQTAEVRRSRPIREFPAEEAYIAALERDTMRGYLDFIDAYPDHPLAKRARAIVAARREAITWRKARIADTPNAYWTYLDRYPHGPHAWDARRRLAYLTAPPEPPRFYTAFDYDLPPPPPAEIIYVERPVLVFSDPVFLFAPPPPPPIFFLPPPPPPLFFPPPPPPIALFVLPAPAFVPIPVWVAAPVYVAPPPNNVIFQNIHNTVVINNTTVNQTTVNAPAAPVAGTPAPGMSPAAIGAGAAVAAAAGVAAAHVALPPAVAARAATARPAGTPPVTQSVSTAPGKALPTPAAVGTPLPGRALPSNGIPQPPPITSRAPPSAPQGKLPLATTGLPPSSQTTPSPAAALPTPSPQRPSAASVAKGVTSQPPPPANPSTRLPSIAPSPAKQSGSNAAPAPRSSATTGAPPPPRSRFDAAAQDRAALDRQVQQQRQRQLEARQQQDAARQRAPEQRPVARQVQTPVPPQPPRVPQAAPPPQTVQRQAPPFRQPTTSPPAAQKKCGIPGAPPCH